MSAYLLAFTVYYYNTFIIIIYDIYRYHFKFNSRKFTPMILFLLLVFGLGTEGADRLLYNYKPFLQHTYNAVA